MTQVSAFFGYGSLVNTATHTYLAPENACLPGWRRVWRGTRLRQVAFLSVEPDPECQIEGLIARVPNNDWAALDAREAAYTRLDVTDALGGTHPTALYQVNPDYRLQNDCAGLLLSYLDVVVQGYLHRFGDAGVGWFFDTTVGWDRPILNDRASPQYPRHQVLTAPERALVDTCLAQAQQGRPLV